MRIFMKAFALDLGDQWIGTAISDSIKFLAKPYKTIKNHELHTFLDQLFQLEKIDIVIIGYPLTMRATESKQTEATVLVKEELEKKYSNIQWILWDERLSSKRAQTLKKAKTKEEKIKSHSLAAAFILESYLTYKSNTTITEESMF
jgi:putative holliday junction resolvase